MDELIMTKRRFLAGAGGLLGAIGAWRAGRLRARGRGRARDVRGHAHPAPNGARG